MHRKTFICALAVLIGSQTAILLHGQTSAQITGGVFDASDAVIPGALITVTNLEKRISRQATANATGHYLMGQLEPGTYKMTVQAQGFHTASIADIRLDVNQSVQLDVKLELGAVTEAVEVQASNPLLDATTAQLGSVITEEKIAELPLNARNFTELLVLNTGSIPVSVGQNATGAEGQKVGAAVYPSINGQQNRSNSFTLDGIYNNGHNKGTYAVAPNVDSLSEFKVQSHSDKPEFGGVAGGVVNIASKSGTNSVHGSLYEFLRNDKFDARSFFNSVKPALRQNQFGGSVGGPVIRNRTFFFFSYEGYRQVNPSSILTHVPTPAELNGDFSGSSRPIYNPYSTRPDPQNANNLLRDPFPNGQIPASLINASDKAYAEAVFPQPTSTGFAAFNHRDTDPQTFPANNYNIRVDHHLSANDWTWFRATWGRQELSAAEGVAGVISQQQIPAKNMGGGYTHTFSSATVFSALFGFSSLTDRTQPTVTSKNLFEEGFFKGMVYDTKQFPNFRAPTIIIPGAFGTLDARTVSLGPMKAWQIHSDVTHVRGRHEIKIGGEVVRQPWTRPQLNGSLQFNTTQTADLNNVGRTGNDTASYVLGLYDVGMSALSTFKLESQLWNAYVQDSWRVTNALTVNFGLRWDLLRNARYSSSFPATWDFSNGHFIVGEKRPPACADSPNAASCLPDPNNPYINQWVTFTGEPKIRKDDYKLFGPRLGLAYRLRPKIVVRGAYGIAYDMMAGVTQQAQNALALWPSKQSVGNFTANRTVVQFNADNPFGGQLQTIAPTPIAAATFLYDPNFQTPYSQQWNVEVQTELGLSTVLKVGYVGSHILRLSVGGDYNTALTPGPGPVQPRQLWPNAPITSYDRSVGQSSYHALQVQTERRLTKGLSYIISYTWSKAIDTASSGQFGLEGQSLQNPYDPNSSRSVSGFDIPHNFTVGILYYLPLGHGQRWLRSGVASRVFGNWQFNGIISARSGQPFTPVMNVDSANIGTTSAQSRARPNLVGDPHPSNPTPQAWFNTAAFAAPASFTFGTAGRNILRTGTAQDFDLSFFREDKITERIKSQFRMEAFNAFNHPTFGIPQTTFTSPTFGVVSTTIGNARQVQLGLKVIF